MSEEKVMKDDYGRLCYVQKPLSLSEISWVPEDPSWGVYENPPLREEDPIKEIVTSCVYSIEEVLKLIRKSDDLRTQRDLFEAVSDLGQAYERLLNNLINPQTEEE